VKVRKDCSELRKDCSELRTELQEAKGMHNDSMPVCMHANVRLE
jgi:hypothetical protein